MLSPDAKNGIIYIIKENYKKNILLPTTMSQVEMGLNPILTNAIVEPKILEIEVKFGKYIIGKYDKFTSEIHVNYFNRLLKYFNSNCMNNSNIKYVNECSELESYNIDNSNIRKIMFIPCNTTEKTKTTYQKKSLVKNDDLILKNYNIRLSYNTEENINQNTVDMKNFGKFKRSRVRHSFIFDNASIDLTKVVQISDGKCAPNKYEVEVELLNKDQNYNEEYLKKIIDDYDNIIKFIYEKLYDTNELYTIQQKTLLTNKISKILNNGDLVKARNIQYNKNKNDLSYENFFQTEKYFITYKADGIRKLLLINSNGIWLIFSNYECNLVVKQNTENKEFLKEYDGTILDGELIPINNYKLPDNINDDIKEYIRIYIGFDCLSVKGKNITNEPYLSRLQDLNNIIKTIEDNTKNSLIYITRKRTEIIETPEQFFILVKNFLDRKDELPYKQDGLIFTKNNKYISGSPPLKWKSSEDITIDFIISWNDDSNIDLYVFDENNNKEIKFEGNNRYPLTSKEILINYNIIDFNKAPTGTVVEFEWKWNQDKTTGYFQPRKIRTDKISANKLTVAKDNWNDIHSPITSSSISGENNELVYKYHNKIKTSLYSLIKKHNIFNPIILDIGSGRGGDIHKWNDLEPTAIIAVEPNKDNLQELKNRLTKSTLNDKVYIVETSFDNSIEDYNKITSAVKNITHKQSKELVGNSVGIAKVDVITLMLSMSFFWKSKESLDFLVNIISNNLNPGGLVLFLTIDGNTLEQFFEPVFSNITQGKNPITKKILDAEITLYPKIDNSISRDVNIVLPNTIVGEQHEYLVYINDLTKKLEKNNIILLEQYRCESEKFLSNENKLFSSLYSYGYYKFLI
jgi:hypothetical protein